MRRRGSKRLAPLILLLACGLGQVAASERLLVGIWINQREVGSLEVRRDSRGFHVPLREFAELAALPCEERPDGALIDTPLGTVELSPSELEYVDGIAWVDDGVLRDRLAVSLQFDQEEFALRLTLPWGHGARRSSGSDAEVRPDIPAPRASLSTFREDLSWVRLDDSSSALSSTMLTGRVGGGFWRVQYEDDLEGGRSLRRYSWFRPIGSTLFLGGRQTIQLHPLMNGFEMTGAQVAWTNRPRELFTSGVDDQELLPRMMRPAETFRGPAPAGSVAELRIDGATVERRTVGLGGEYEFLDVVLPSRQVSHIEIVIYDRSNLSTPISVRQISLSASEFLMEGGAEVHMGGLGGYGDAARDWIDEDSRDGVAGFYQWRRGLSRGLTLEAGVQATDGTHQLMTGIVSRLAPRWVMSTGLAASEGKPGFAFDLEGHHVDWTVRAGSQWKPEGFVSPTSEPYYDHLLETWYGRWQALDIGLVSRSRRAGKVRSEFALPAFTWRHRAGVYLRARPDLYGEYNIYGSWRASPVDRVNLNSNRTTAIDYIRRLGNRYELLTGVEFGGGYPERQSLTLRRNRSRPGGASWAVGAVHRGAEWGAAVSAETRLAPGTLARLEYQSLPSPTYEPRHSSDRLSLSITVDLAVAGGRVVPTGGSSQSPTSGALAGRIVRDGLRPATSHDMRDVSVLVDGRRRAHIDARGNFFLGNLEPGVHVVEVDPENLPIELAVRTPSTTVEVAAGATTRIDFQLDAEYGLAGRVRTASGEPAIDVLVELLDSNGRRVRTARTDRFGLFRMDGIPVGVYDLRPAEQAGPAREVEFVDRFLFDQDLVLGGEMQAAR